MDRATVLEDNAIEKKAYFAPTVIVHEMSKTTLSSVGGHSDGAGSS